MHDERNHASVPAGWRLIAPALGMLLALLIATTFQASAVPANGAGSSETSAQERVAVADEAPDFALESVDGESYRLSEQRGEKNVLIIFFRGSW